MVAKHCPVCGTELMEIEKYDVEIDTCPRCKGVWLDKGELEKIISRIREEYYEVEHEIPGYKEYYERKKKKKPFEMFEDLFG